MNLDIVRIADGFDLGLQRSDVPRAGNIVSTQIGYLEYAQGFGVDRSGFLGSEVIIPTQAYATHLIQRLSEHGVRVSDSTLVVGELMQTFSISVGENSGSDTDGGLIL